MAFGSHIKNLRTKKGISAERMARILNVDATRFRKWEQRDYNPKEHDVLSIEAIFGMKMESILQLEDLPDFAIVQKKSDKIKVSQGTEREEIITALATSAAVIDHLAKLMAAFYKRDVLECKDDLISTIALRRKELIGE